MKPILSSAPANRDSRNTSADELEVVETREVDEESKDGPGAAF